MAPMGVLKERTFNHLRSEKHKTRRVVDRLDSDRRPKLEIANRLCNAVHVWVDGRRINTKSRQLSSHTVLFDSWEQNLFELWTLEWRLGIAMKREHAALRNNPGIYMRWSNQKILLHIKRGFSYIGFVVANVGQWRHRINRADIFRVTGLDGKEQRDQWAPRPIKEASGETVVLGKNQKFELVPGAMGQVEDALVFKQFERVVLSCLHMSALGIQPMRLGIRAANRRNEPVIGIADPPEHMRHRVLPLKSKFDKRAHVLNPVLLHAPPLFASLSAEILA